MMACATRTGQCDSVCHGIFVLLLILAVIDKTNESPRRSRLRRVQQMAQAADAADANRFIEHLADTIEYRGGSQPVVVKKEEMRNSPFWSMLRQFNVHVAVWDFSRDDVKEIDAGTIEVGFAAKGESLMTRETSPLYMRATFKKQPDGQWKLVAISSFKFERHDEPFLIPNFPALRAVIFARARLSTSPRGC